MTNMFNTSENTLINSSIKDTKYFENQEKILYKYLLNNTVSNTMLFAATNISQKNICRFKSKYEKKGLLVVVSHSFCKITKRKVQFLSTNPEIIKNINSKSI